MCPHLPLSLWLCHSKGCDCILLSCWGLDHYSVQLYYLYLLHPAKPGPAEYEASVLGDHKAAKQDAADPAERRSPRRPRVLPRPGGGAQGWTNTCPKVDRHRKTRVLRPSLSQKPNICPGGTDGWDLEAALSWWQTPVPVQRDRQVCSSGHDPPFFPNDFYNLQGYFQESAKH